MLCAPDSCRKSPFARLWIAFGLFLLLGQLAAFADGSVVLTWSASTDPNAVGYKIYYGGASGDYTNVIEAGNVTAYTVSGLSGGTTYYFSATTVSASGQESPFSNEAVYQIPADTNSAAAPNQPPTLDPIAGETINQNAGLQTVSLTGISAGTTSGNPIVISATSSDTTIISTPTVTYNSPDSTGTLTFAPVANATGTATITVTVDNGGASNNLATRTFTVTVQAPPPPLPTPTLDAVTNLVIYQNAGTQTVSLTGISSGITSGYQSIAIWAYVGGDPVISTPVINYTSPNSTGSITFAPVTSATGTATVQVKVNNGVNNFSQTFTVTVLPAPVVVSQPPTLDPIAGVTIVQGTALQVVTLTGITAGSGDGKTMKVTATSSNTRLVPTPKVVYAGPASTAALELKVGVGTGTSTISVTVNNGAKSNNIVSQTFIVSVIPVPDPTLNTVANISVPENASTQTVVLTGITSGSPLVKQALKVTAASSNTKVVLAPTVQYTSPGNTAVLMFKPSGKFTGTSALTITVAGGKKSVRHQFMVTVTPAVTTPPITNFVATLKGIARANGTFGFQVTGAAGSNYVVQATSDLLNWTPVQTNQAPFVFQENVNNGVSQRFYRAVYLPSAENSNAGNTNTSNTGAVRQGR